MKKICGVLVFTVLFFTVKSFGGNHISNPDVSKFSINPVSPKEDTLKKTDAKDTADADSIRSYAFGVNYGSDQQYHGVHSDLKLPYIQPNFTYTAPKGFYCELLDQYIIGGGSKYNAFAVDPGWNIDLADNTTLNFNWEHFFLGSHPPQILASVDISNTIETYIEQWIGETEGKLSVDYDIYKRTSKVKTPNDIIISPEVLHDFKITLGKKSSLTLEPEGSIDFGTRNSYTHAQANANNNEQSPKKDTLKNNSSFGTLDYLLAFSVDYKVGNFECEPGINYDVPLYAVPNVPSKPIAYVTIALTYTIDHKIKPAKKPTH